MFRVVATWTMESYIKVNFNIIPSKLWEVTIIIIRRRSIPTGTVELLKVLESFPVLADIDKMSVTGTVDCPLTEVYDSPNPHLDRLLNKTTPPCPFKPFIFFAVALVRFVISDKNLLRMYIFSDH